MNSAGSACSALNVLSPLVSIAQEFSPRYEIHGDHLIAIDVSGLERLLGPPRVIAHELRREAVDRGLVVHVAVAGTRMAALVLALARPGITVVERGSEAAALAPLSISLLEQLDDIANMQKNPNQEISASSASSAVSVLKRWGLTTLGELAALPAADLSARLGRQGPVCQAIARGEDRRPLVPALADERFESSLELEWPIEGLEPLSFVLTRLLEPLSTRLERRDRGAAVLHVLLRLTTRDCHARRLELPAPLRDVRTLRSLALIDLESHPPPAAVEHVAVVIDPTPGRVLQRTLFARAHPTPDAISTLLARLAALVGQDRIGAPAVVDSYRPGAFAMTPFAVDHDNQRRERRARRELCSNSRPASVNNVASAQQTDSAQDNPKISNSAGSAVSAFNVVSGALRRCRPPVAARVAEEGGRPVRVTTDRRSYPGGAVLGCAGPWRTSGNWWATRAGRAGRAGGEGKDGESSRAAMPSRVDGEQVMVGAQGRPVLDMPESYGSRASGMGVGPHASNKWDRDEWDVALADGAVYRIFRDCETDRWFIDAIVD